MRGKLAAAAVAGIAGVVVLTTPAHAIPSPVTIQAGGCPANYTEVARILGQAVCVYQYSPDVTVITNGAPCPAGTVEYVSLFNTYRVCVG